MTSMHGDKVATRVFTIYTTLLIFVIVSWSRRDTEK